VAFNRSKWLKVASSKSSNEWLFPTMGDNMTKKSYNGNAEISSVYAEKDLINPSKPKE
jgi:hypothetical protein